MLRYHFTPSHLSMFRRCVLGMVSMGLAVVPLALFAQHGVSITRVARTAGKSKSKPSPARTRFSGSDVMATVDGQPITRRELTYVWLSTDSHVALLLSDLLTNRIRADKASASAYIIPTSEIYARLYGDTPAKTTPYAETLSNLVTTHLLEMRARREGIIVTRTEALAEAHKLFEQVRTQKGLHLTDEQMMVEFRLPRDIFLNDMLFRLRTERLIAADIARHNGHSIGPDDWIVVRELFASAEGADDKTSEQRFTEARSRIDSWLQEIKSGKNMADVAAEHNEDATRDHGGLLNPALRGAGTRTIENAIYALKPGEMSAPLRGKNGWYVFRLEQRGSQIDAQVRRAMWEKLVETQRPQFLAALRHSAQITSVVPLPTNEPPAQSVPAASSEMPPAPPTIPVQ